MSRDLAGRVDVDAVGRSCERLVNFELLQSGAVRRRCGSRWLCDLGGDGRPVAMQAFGWSDGGVSVVVVWEGCGRGVWRFLMVLVGGSVFGVIMVVVWGRCG